MKKTVAMLVLALIAGAAYGKLPALSPEAKAKADEAKAKTAWSDKVAGYKLCLSQEKVAARYYADMKAKNKDAKPATQTAACADPGAFVWPPVEQAAAPAAVPTQSAAAAPAKK